MLKLLSSINIMKLLNIFKTFIKMDGQDRKLQLTKVKTGNAGLSCYMTSKIDIVILLTKTKKHEHLSH